MNVENGAGQMADDAESGSTPSLYQEMKRLAQTAIDLAGLKILIAQMDYLVFSHLDKKGEISNRNQPIVKLDAFFPIYEGDEEITLYHPFEHLSENELEYLHKISHNRSISCKVYGENGVNKVIYSMMVRIPSQPHLPQSQTINCEIEFHGEFDEVNEEDLAIVDLVTWYDEAIDEKLVKRARTSYALMASA